MAKKTTSSSKTAALPKSRAGKIVHKVTKRLTKPVRKIASPIKDKAHRTVRSGFRKVKNLVGSGSTFQRVPAWLKTHVQAEQIPLYRRWAISILLVLAFFTSVATYVAMRSAPPLGEDPERVLFLLCIDLVILLLLSGAVIWRLFEIWLSKRRGFAGSRLHLKLMFFFGAVAVTPTIILALFSSLFFNLGIQSWFSERVRTAVHQSMEVADDYLDEHKQNIRGDVLAMAVDVHRAFPTINKPSDAVNKLVEIQMKLRGLSDVIIFDRNNHVVARTGLVTQGLQGNLMNDPIPIRAIEQARKYQIVVITSKHEDRVKALVRLSEDPEQYLYVGRTVAPGVMSHIDKVKRAVEKYEALEGRRSHLEISFAMIFAIIALMLLMMAMAAGFWLATHLVEPVQTLILASRKLGQGDLSTRVNEKGMKDEWKQLSKAFNHMAEELQNHQKELLLIQKHAAWRDVARRVAHEIKNPLTPIQLAAERLKKKYLPLIEQDPETFHNLVDTISRQVEDIGRLVDEFAAYARMPAPKIKEENFADVVRGIFLLHANAHPDVKFDLSLPKTPFTLACDAGQMREVLTNIIQNALHAIHDRAAAEENAPAGEIRLSLEKSKENVRVILDDNGLGLPAESPEDLTKAYVTTRQKGTGLGLNIVKKIMGDHNGELLLEHREDEHNKLIRGTRVILTFHLHAIYGD